MNKHIPCDEELKHIDELNKESEKQKIRILIDKMIEKDYDEFTRIKNKFERK